ncbi:hypothetical protein C8K36_102438 [Rhodococcus sp. OK519]|uniref:hypothetical protein n=1 Tax=Rhodococcus sp. OK519 TaxID=2135729 RepID=UPI000D3CC9F1|nr:hypothetical protein C8K36_102438 [Rhodococcus sp. OK519]
MSIVRAFRTPPPWRVVKNGRYTPTATGADLVIQNWLPDSGFPDVAHVSGILVPDAATVTVRAQVTRTVTTSNNWGLSLTLNGVEILGLTNASIVGSSLTVSVPNVAVVEGDVLSVRIRTAQASWAVVESGAVTFLEAFVA